MRKLRLDFQWSPYKRQIKKIDELFKIYVTASQNSIEFDSVIESGYLWNNSHEKCPEVIKEVSKKFGFDNEHEFIHALERWLDLNPVLHGALTEKRLRKYESIQNEITKKIAANHEESKKNNAKRNQIWQKEQLKKRLQNSQARKKKYLNDKQDMINDALVYHDLLERFETCKRWRSRRKWRDQIQLCEFAQFLEEGIENQTKYKNLVLTGIFDKKGINYDTPGKVYLVRHLELNAMKIGITSNSSTTDRVSVHQNAGWHLLRVWDFNKTWDAYLIEQQIVRWWRDELELSHGVSPAQIPQGGFSETVPYSDDIYSETSKYFEMLQTQPKVGKRPHRSNMGTKIEANSRSCWCGGKWRTRRAPLGFRSGALPQDSFLWCSRWPYCLEKRINTRFTTKHN